MKHFATIFLIMLMAGCTVSHEHSQQSEQCFVQDVGETKSKGAEDNAKLLIPLFETPRLIVPYSLPGWPSYQVKEVALTILDPFSPPPDFI